MTAKRSHQALVMAAGDLLTFARAEADAARIADFLDRAAHTLFNRCSAAHEVAVAVTFLASDAASDVTGSALVVHGGGTAIDGPPTGLTRTDPS